MKKVSTLLTTGSPKEIDRNYDIPTVPLGNREIPLRIGWLALAEH
jgi:hypothetical protein